MGPRRVRLLGQGQPGRPLAGVWFQGPAHPLPITYMAPSSPGASRWLQPFALVPEDGGLSVPTRSTRTSCSTTPAATVCTSQGRQHPRALRGQFPGNSLAFFHCLSFASVRLNVRLFPEHATLTPTSRPLHVLCPLPRALSLLLFTCVTLLLLHASAYSIQTPPRNLP